MIPSLPTYAGVPRIFVPASNNAATTAADVVLVPPPDIVVVVVIIVIIVVIVFIVVIAEMDDLTYAVVPKVPRFPRSIP
jgi:hypothetical protein